VVNRALGLPVEIVLLNSILSKSLWGHRLRNIRRHCELKCEEFHGSLIQ